MRCCLFVPRQFSTEPPTLRLFGARGKSLPPPLGGPEAWLCTAFGVARQIDWPAAPFALLGEGTDPGSGYWLRADPVHLRLLRNHLLLFGGAELTITLDEAQSWRDALEKHFGSDGLHFAAPHPLRWYLRLPDATGPVTHPLSEVLGQEIRPFLPQGTRELKLFNEIQMLLHADPRNAEREEHGLPLVNGLWLWGGGSLPEELRAPCGALYADDPLARGLALAAHIPAYPLPLSARECLADTQQDIMIVVDGATPDSLEQDWLVPLKQALAAGQIEQLAVIVPGRRHTEVTRSDLWKFWRRG